MDKNGKKISEVRGMIDRKNAQQMAEALVDKMTVDEMIGQLKFDARQLKDFMFQRITGGMKGSDGVARAGTATVFPTGNRYGGRPGIRK